MADNHALAAADDEVAAEILRALSQGSRVEVLLVVEKAVFAADHDRNLAEVDVGEEALPRDALTLLRIVDECRLHTDIYEEGRGVGQIAQTSIIRHHGQNRAVVLKDGRLAQTDILKENLDLIFVLRLCRRSTSQSLDIHQSIGRSSRETGRRGKSRART